MALSDRVEDYVGPFSDNGALSSWLLDSVRRHFDLVPLEKMERYLTTTVFTPATGLAVTNYRPAYVRIGGKRARMLNVQQLENASSSTSLNYGTAADPVCWILGGTLHGYPSSTNGGSLYAVKYPTAVLHSDSTIENCPPELTDIIILDVAVRCLTQKLNTARIAVGALTWTAPSAPTPPADASFTYTDAVAGSFSASISGLPITTEWTELYTYLDDEEDIELARAKLEEISTLIAQYRAQVEAWLGENSAEIAQTSETSRVNALQNLRKQVEEYGAKIAKFQSQVQLYSTQFQGEASRYQSELAKLRSDVETYQLQISAMRSIYYDALSTFTGIKMSPEAKQ